MAQASLEEDGKLSPPALMVVGADESESDSFAVGDHFTSSPTNLSSTTMPQQGGRGTGDAGSLGAGSGDFCESFEDYGEVDADRSGFGLGGATEKWARNSFIRSSIRGSKRRTKNGNSNGSCGTGGYASSNASDSGVAAVTNNELVGEIDESIYFLTDKVRQLEDKLGELSDNQSEMVFRHLKSENQQLRERILTFEEQVREADQRCVDEREVADRRLRESLTKAEREKATEISFLTSAVQKLQRDADSSAANEMRLQEELKRVQAEVRCLREDLRLTEGERDSLQEELSSRESALLEADRRLSTQEADAAAELNELRQQLVTALSQVENTAGGPTVEMWQRRCRELEEQASRYKDEIRELRESNEKLSLRVVTEGLDSVDRSLAAQVTDEIWPEDKDSTELHKNLREQQDANRRLREYVGQLIVLIIEHNPSLLDITNRSSPTSLSSKPGLQIADTF